MTRRSLLLSIPAVGLLRAQTQKTPDRGRKVVMDSLAALGGDRYLAMEDRIEGGRAFSFYREQISGRSIAKIYTRYLAPGRPAELAVRERQAFGKNEDSAILFLESGEGWEVTFRGARPLPKDQLERYKRTTLHNVFYIFRERLKEPGMTFDYQQQDILDNQPVDIVDITDSRDETTTVYFHQSTKMPVKQVFYWRDPITRERNEEVTLFSKFRDVGGGVQWPFDIHRERNGEKIYEMFSDSVSINRDLKDNFFTLPEGIKKLKPVG